jgi:hypothetical protein
MLGPPFAAEMFPAYVFIVLLRIENMRMAESMRHGGEARTNVSDVRSRQHQPSSGAIREIYIWTSKCLPWIDVAVR